MASQSMKMDILPDLAKPGLVELGPLPYAKDALEPHISENTLNFHYGKHHAGYVNKLKAAIANDTSLKNHSVLDILQKCSGSVFNVAAQHWNHTFYWKCMSPNGGGEPNADLLRAIESSFGSYSKFKEQFSHVAAGHFASGWAWLVKDQSGDLKIVDTHDADNPIRHNMVPILTCDVWEHAYYLDYQNDRGAYIAAFWKVVDWNFVSDNFSA